LLTWGDPELKQELSDATNARFAMLTKGVAERDSDEFTGHIRLHSGVNTAMETEATMLDTIRQRTLAGESITREGLSKSQRVPFAFAMQALADHAPEDDDWFTWAYVPNVDINGCPTYCRLLRPEVAQLSAEQGLILTAELPKKTGPSIYAGEPTIGCPATLVKDFVRNMHDLAAEVCVQSGIIEPVD
jgi:hypothetical protein